MGMGKTAQLPGNFKIESKSVSWTGKKIAICAVLFVLSLVCISVGLQPILTGIYDVKSFANLIFVVFHAFYMFSFTAVHRNSQFFFWALSYFMLDAITFIFVFYDDIFF